MSVGERISELRKQKNMSQAQLAQMMDVTRQAVSKWESDQSSPDTLRLIQLADALDTDVEYLATGRASLGVRPPVVVKTVETVEKIVEQPVYVEKVVERVVEKPVVQYVEKPVVQYIEKPVIRKVIRTKSIRNPWEFALVGGICFLIGIVVGLLF